eukprot:1646821-Pyramimonas_sp.AAC.1
MQVTRCGLCALACRARSRVVAYLPKKMLGGSRMGNVVGLRLLGLRGPPSSPRLDAARETGQPGPRETRATTSKHEQRRRPGQRCRASEDEELGGGGGGRWRE